MCGIAGILHRDPRQLAPRARVWAMCDAMTHRGRDDALDEMKDDWSEALLALLTFQIWKDRLHERSLTLQRRLYAGAAL